MRLTTNTATGGLATALKHTVSAVFISLGGRLGNAFRLGISPVVSPLQVGDDVTLEQQFSSWLCGIVCQARLWVATGGAEAGQQGAQGAQG